METKRKECKCWICEDIGYCVIDVDHYSYKQFCVCDKGKLEWKKDHDKNQEMLEQMHDELNFPLPF